jgi:hypothetical protein
MTTRTYFVFSIFYAVFALALSGLLLDDLSKLLPGATMAFEANISLVIRLLAVFFPCLLLGVIRTARAGRRGELMRLFAALAGCVALQVGFLCVKSLIPAIVPYYADPLLARLGRWLHFGQDAWMIAHSVPGGAFFSSLQLVYVDFWLLPALFLPVVLVVFDSDEGRVRRFTLMFVLCWIGLGNVAAILGSSVGPVFYDSIYGSDRFAQLNVALKESGIIGGIVGQQQDFLLNSYRSGNFLIGSGISAFPSLHVAMATLFALYLVDRSRKFMPLSAGYVILVLFMSVYTGYHYAIDGYFSILAVFLMHFALRRLRFAAKENYVLSDCQAANGSLERL